jgi:hypothetical protein
MGQMASIGGGREVYTALVEKPEEQRKLGRLRHRWKDIKINLKEIKWNGVGLD